MTSEAASPHSGATIDSGAAAHPTAWLLALCAVQLGTLLVFMSFAGALPLIQADWSLSNAQAGAIQAGRQIGYVLSVVILTSLTDRVRAERLIAGSALGAAASNMAFALLARGATSGMILQAFTGAGVAGIYMPGVRLISYQIPSARRGRAVGLFVGSFTLGAAASIALGGGLAATLGWRTAFGLTSLGPLVGALIAWRVVSPMTSQLAGEDRPAQRPREGREDSPPLSALFRNRPALLAMATYTAHAWEVLGLRSWLPSFLAAALLQAGASLDEATRSGAAMAGVATVMGAIGVAVVAALSDCFGRSRTIMVVTSASCVCLLALGASLALPWTLIVGVGLLAGFMANADSAVISTTLTETVPEEILGRVLGVYSFLGFSAGAIAPLAFGAVLDTVGSSSSGLASASPAGWAWAFATLALGSLLALTTATALNRALRGR